MAPVVGSPEGWSAIGYFRSSRIVLPIRTWVPRVRVVGWEIRLVPT